MGDVGFGGIKLLKSYRVLLCGTAVLAAILVPSARADEPIEEVTVTALRQNQSLQQTPASVDVLDSQLLENAGVKRVDDIVALSPGVSIVNDTAEAGDTQVNIRGINGARDAENSFAFVVDGILLPNPASFNREFVDLSQIEVLEGPQGAIYGRNAEAGAIVVTTREPTTDPDAMLRFSYGNHNSITSEGTVGGPILGNTLLGRFSFDTRDTDGFFTNRYQGGASTVDESHDYNFNGRLIWNPDNDTSVDFKGRIGHLNAAAIDFNAIFQVPALVPFLGPYIDEDANAHNFDFTNNIVPKNIQDSRELSAKLDHDFGWAKFTGWGLYSNIDNNFLSDGTDAAFGFYNRPNTKTGVNTCAASIASLVASGFQFTPPQGPGLLAAYTPTTCDGYQYQVRNQQDYSFEARLSSPAGEALRWSGGLYYLHIDRHVGVSIGEDPGTSFTPALFSAVGSGFATAQEFNDQFTTDVYAGFGSVAYDILPTVELTGAIRYDIEDRSVQNLVPANALQPFVNITGNFATPGPYQLNPGFVANPKGIPPQSKTFEQPEPKFTARWDIDPDLSAYASYGVGFKSGGFNSSGSAATVAALAKLTSPTPADVHVSDSYDKETSDAFEGGFKGKLLDGKLTYQLDGFYTIVHNLQFFEFFTTPFGLLRVDSNIDRVTIGGFQFGGQARVNDWLSVNGGFELNDSNIDKNSSRPDTVGNKSPYTPDYTATIGVQATHPVTDALTGIIRVDTNLTGDTWFSTVQTQTVPSLFGPANYSNSKRDAYETVDLRMALIGGHYEVAVFAQNLFDEHYLEEVIPAPEFGGSFVAPGARRLFGVELTYNF